MVIELRQQSVYGFMVISWNIKGLRCGDARVSYNEILYGYSLFKAQTKKFDTAPPHLDRTEGNIVFDFNIRDDFERHLIQKETLAGH